MLTRRLIVSAVLIPLLAAVFYFDQQAGGSAPYLLILCLVLAALAAWELATLFRARDLIQSFVCPVFCAVVIVLAGWHFPCCGTTQASTAGLARILLVFALSVLLLFAKSAFRYSAPGDNLKTLGAEILIVSYVGVLLAVTAQLRWVAGADTGYLVLGSLLIAVKAGDIGAYTLGRLFGRRKMAPLLSPGKTWMGAFGALLAAGLASWTWLRWAPQQFHPDWRMSAWYWAVLYGVVLGFVGVIGDLAESLIKRDLGQKHSSNVIPGFGGVLDLLDSILFAGPVAYLLWQLMPLVTWQ